MTDNTIYRCKKCYNYDFYSEFRWSDGNHLCRNCYKQKWERENNKTHQWTDLNTPLVPRCTNCKYFVDTKGEYQRYCCLDAIDISDESKYFCCDCWSSL
ncbi:MAG: hypothetical protein FWC41_00025 [Firmicutes bacterium]|nr:hypothetical protein [Bacillota bacterium]